MIPVVELSRFLDRFRKGGDEGSRRLPPGQSLTEKFPVLHYGPIPDVDLSDWDFRVFGLVEEEARWTWEEFSDLPRRKVVLDIHCVTRWSRLNNLFEGPSVRTIMERVNIKPGATHVLIHTEGEPGRTWTTNLPLDEFMDEDCLFAYKNDDEWLTPDHGAPVRLVVPRLYFWKSAKWVRGIELRNGDAPGFWEQNGYHMHGDPWTEERFGW